MRTPAAPWRATPHPLSAAPGTSGRRAALVVRRDAADGADYICEVGMNARQARKLIKVQYWPNTNQWRILVAGSAVGYWDDKDEADLRARSARRGLVESLTEHSPREEP